MGHQLPRCAAQRIRSPPAHFYQHTERRRAPTRTACTLHDTRAGPYMWVYNSGQAAGTSLAYLLLSLSLSVRDGQSLGQKARDPLPQCSETEKEGATPRPTDQSACSTPHDEKAPPRHSLLRLPSLRKAFRSGHKSSRML